MLPCFLGKVFPPFPRDGEGKFSRAGKHPTKRRFIIQWIGKSFNFIIQSIDFSTWEVPGVVYQLGRLTASGGWPNFPDTPETHTHTHNLRKFLGCKWSFYATLLGPPYLPVWLTLQRNFSRRFSPSLKWHKVAAIFDFLRCFLLCFKNASSNENQITLGAFEVSWLSKP